jgi:hypothetical protein
MAGCCKHGKQISGPIKMEVEDVPDESSNYYILRKCLTIEGVGSLKLHIN